jgi:hypothetical protein
MIRRKHRAALRGPVLKSPVDSPRLSRGKNGLRRIYDLRFRQGEKRLWGQAEDKAMQQLIRWLSLTIAYDQAALVERFWPLLLAGAGALTAAAFMSLVWTASTIVRADRHRLARPANHSPAASR